MWLHRMIFLSACLALIWDICLSSQHHDVTIPAFTHSSNMGSPQVRGVVYGAFPSPFPVHPTFLLFPDSDAQAGGNLMCSCPHCIPTPALRSPLLAAARDLRLLWDCCSSRWPCRWERRRRRKKWEGRTSLMDERERRTELPLEKEHYSNKIQQIYYGLGREDEDRRSWYRRGTHFTINIQAIQGKEGCTANEIERNNTLTHKYFWVFSECHYERVRLITVNQRRETIYGNRKWYTQSVSTS